MGAGSWHSLRWPNWRVRLETGVQRLQGITNATPTQRVKSIRRGFLVAGGLVLFFTASSLWRALLMGAAGAALVLILQELTDPSPLFWAAPWEAVQFVLSRKVRVNHLWLHRTQELVRDSVGWSTKLDGFATSEGFLLMTAALNEAEVRWTAEFAWQTLLQGYTAQKSACACKAARFLLALWLIAGGLLFLGIWQGIDLPSGLLLAAVCAAAAHGLARPFEQLSDRWIKRVACRQDRGGRFRFEVEHFELPAVLWFEGGQSFWVRRIPAGSWTRIWRHELPLGSDRAGL